MACASRAPNVARTTSVRLLSSYLQSRWHGRRRTWQLRFLSIGVVGVITTGLHCISGSLLTDWCVPQELRGATEVHERRARVALHAEGGSVDAGNEADSDAGDDLSAELFRQSLIRGWGGGVVGSSGADDAEWADVLELGTGDVQLEAGDVLLANPFHWLGGGEDAAGPARVGLDGKFDPDWPRREQLRLMPTVLLTNVEPNGTAQGLMLSVRTGRLMGDFINHFHSRPLLYGGPSEAGLTMVHPYSQVNGSRRLMEGLYVGGDFQSAQEWAEDGEGSSLRFRFFLNSVQWEAGGLAAEATGAAAPWIPIRCAAEVPLWEVDSIEEKPMWVRVAELAGGRAEAAAREFDLM